MGYLLAALVGGFLLFNQAASPKKAAQLAEKALQKQYPGAAVDVQIEGKRGKDVLNGRFKRVHIELSHLTLAQVPFAAPEANSSASRKRKIGRAQKIEVELRDLTLGQMPVPRARLDFSDVQYDFLALKNRAQFEILQSGPASLQLQLSASALLPSFAEKLKDTADVSLSIEGKILRINGTRSVLGRATPIVISGELAGRGSQLHLENTALSLNGATVPTLAANALLKDLNPLYDFDKDLKWPFRTQISGASGQGDRLDISANLLLPNAGAIAANTAPEKVGNIGVPIGQ